MTDDEQHTIGFLVDDLMSGNKDTKVNDEFSCVAMRNTEHWERQKQCAKMSTPIWE